LQHHNNFSKHHHHQNKLPFLKKKRLHSFVRKNFADGKKDNFSEKGKKKATVKSKDLEHYDPSKQP